jgi:outer membrane protein OmpA-like peptidoglycan-associated protein
MNIFKSISAIAMSGTLIAGCSPGATEHPTPSTWTLTDGGWWATVTDLPLTTVPGCTSSPSVVAIGSDLLFEFGSSRLTTTAREVITAVTDLLASGTSVRVCGHADIVGSEEANIRLSKERAEEVAKAMGAAGFTPARIVGVEGYGSSRPRALPADTPSNRALNRRVEIERVS